MSISQILSDAAAKHIGQKREVLLAAARLMAQHEEQEEQHRAIERALETLPWFDAAPVGARSHIIGAVLMAKAATEKGLVPYTPDTTE